MTGQPNFSQSASSFGAQSAAVPSAELDAAPSQHGCIKQILAYVDGTEKDLTVLDHALAVAQRFVSHIDVLHVRFDVRGVSAGTERYVDRLLDIPVEGAVTEAATQAHRHFEQWQTQCKLPLRESGLATGGPSTLVAGNPRI